MCSAGGVRRRTLVRDVTHILPYGPRCSVPSCVMSGSGASEKNNHPQDRIKVRTGPLPPSSMLTVFRGKGCRREKTLISVRRFAPSASTLRLGARAFVLRGVCVTAMGVFFARTGIDCGCSMVMCKLSRVRARDVARGVISVCAVASCTAPSERQQGCAREMSRVGSFPFVRSRVAPHHPSGSRAAAGRWWCAATWCVAYT